MGMKFTNNATSTLATGITNVATTLTVATGQGALFPTLGAGDYFYCTLANLAGAVEIIKVTARTGDTFTTIIRAQDSTSALAWNAGDKVELRLVSASLNDFPKLDEANTFSGPASTFTNPPTMTSPLTVANGGTSAATHTANSLLVGNGASAFSEIAPSTARNALLSNGTSWVSGTIITLGTPVASTSGTAILFTGIPAGVKRVTVNLKGVSTNGTNPYLFQIGSGSVVTSGYLGTGSLIGASTASSTSYTAGFGVQVNLATAVLHGTLTLSLENSTNNTWVCNYMLARSDLAGIHIGGGSLSLSGNIDRVNLTTAGGTDTFDAGEINITYE